MLGSMKHPALLTRATFSRGVTLVELMVVLAIAAVLLAIALPSARDFVARKRLEGVAQELASDLRLLKAHQIQNRPGNGTAILFSHNDSKICYMLYRPGNGRTAHCDCGLDPEQMCGKAGEFGNPVPIRQVDIPKSTGITFTPDPDVLVVNGHHGLPMFEEALHISVKGARVGEIQVSNSPTGVPSICSKSGVFGAIRACPE